MKIQNEYMNVPLSVKLSLQSATLNALLFLSLSLSLSLTPIFSLQRVSPKQSLKFSENIFLFNIQERRFLSELGNQSEKG